MSKKEMARPYSFTIDASNPQYKCIRESALLNKVLMQARDEGRFYPEGSYYIFGGFLINDSVSLCLFHNTQEGLEEMLGRIGYKRARESALVDKTK